MRSPLPPSWTPYLLSVLRIAAAFLFLFHGTQKLFAFPPSEMGRADLASLTGVAGVIEFAGGLLMLAGLLTRPVAFVLAGEMAYAYFSVHAPGALLPLQNRGELAALYAFVWLYFSAAGGGPWSVDSLLVRGRRSDDAARDTLTSQAWSTPRSTTTRSRELPTSRPRRS
jgi:putative oxidoreductase